MELYLDRLKTRLTGEDLPADEFLTELLQTIQDRLCLRIGEETLPDILGSILIDATVKLYRRRYYSGISSEGDEGLTASFVEDILDEYSTELQRYRSDFAEDEDGEAKGLVRFI